MNRRLQGRLRFRGHVAIRGVSAQFLTEFFLERSELIQFAGFEIEPRGENACRVGSMPCDAFQRHEKPQCHRFERAFPQSLGFRGRAAALESKLDQEPRQKRGVLQEHFFDARVKSLSEILVRGLISKIKKHADMDDLVSLIFRLARKRGQKQVKPFLNVNCKPGER